MDNIANIEKYLPQIIADVQEYQQITSSENVEMNEAWQSAEQIACNFFVLFSNEYGVSRYETMLGIKPKDTDSLADRQYRVFTMLSSKLPYTFKALDSMLNILTSGSYDLSVNEDVYEVFVRVGLDQKNQYDAVDTILKKWIPANMVIDLSLLFNTYFDAKPFSHIYLANKTYKDIREEVL